jgi:hypothetical protein
MPEPDCPPVVAAVTEAKTVEFEIVILPAFVVPDDETLPLPIPEPIPAEEDIWMETDDVEIQMPRTVEFPDEDPLPIPEPTPVLPENDPVTVDSNIEMAPTLELPVPALLLPIHEPYAVETRVSTIDSETVMSPTLEPSDPYPLPIPLLLEPVAVTVEFERLM